MAKFLQGILRDEIEKVDKIGNGVYKVTLKDSSIKELSLDRGEAISIQAELRHRNRNPSDDAPQKTDEQPKVDSSAQNLKLKKEITRKALERNLGNWMEVDFKDPDLEGYWPTQDNIAKRKRLGYEFAVPDDIEDFDEQFGDFNPGEGLNPNGHITRQGHTLMKIRKELADIIREHNYKKRDRYLPENRQGYLSMGQVAQKRAQLGI